MATYTTRLGLFKPTSDNNIAVRQSLDDNFQAIEDKLGNALVDRNQVVWATLGARLDDYQTKIDTNTTDINNLKNKSVNVLLNHHHFRVIALRGIPGAPENTLISYRYAVEWGYWGVYADVQLTSDNNWVMYAYSDLSTKTNGSGAVSSKTLTQIKALDCGSSFNALWAGEQIPTLDQFLLICRSTQSVPFINVVGTYTDVQIKTLTDKLRSWDLINDAVVVSSTLANLQNVRLYTQALAVGLYMSTFSDTTLTDIQNLKNSFALMSDAIITSSNMASAQNKNIPVVAYMNTDTNQAIRDLISLGIRGAVTLKAPGIRGV